MAGSLTAGNGLVFLGRAGVSALQVWSGRLEPPPPPPCKMLYTPGRFVQVKYNTAPCLYFNYSLVRLFLPLISVPPTPP